MSIDTTQLLNRLDQAEDIRAFLVEYEKEFHAVSFSELLRELSVEKDISVAEVARRSGQGDYVYKVFQGLRKPSRDIVVAIAVGMSLRLNETQLLLRVAKLATLDPRDKRDSILLYGLKEKLDVNKLNDLLYDLQEKTL